MEVNGECGSAKIVENVNKKTHNRIIKCNIPYILKSYDRCVRVNKTKIEVIVH